MQSPSGKGCCNRVAYCVCINDADTVLLLNMSYSFFFLSSYSTFPLKFVLDSPSQKQA